MQQNAFSQRLSLRGLRAELSGNPRLALLLLLIPTLLAIYLALLTREAVTTARAERAPLQLRAARLSELDQSGDWAQRIVNERAMLSRLESGMWRAGSAQLAAADLQTVLQRTAATHLSWSRLKLSPAQELASIGGWRIEAELNGRLKNGEVIGLLQELSEHQPVIHVDQMNLSLQRAQSVLLQLSILVTPEASSP